MKREQLWPLPVAAERICGPDGAGMKDPVAWVRRQVKKGRFHAYKIGRELRMSDEQIAEARRKCLIEAKPKPKTDQNRFAAAMSPTTRRRMKRSA